MSECLIFTNLWHIIVSAKLPIFSTNRVVALRGVSTEYTSKHCQTVNQQDGCFSVLHGLFGCCTPAQKTLQPDQTTQGLLSAFCSSKTTVIKFQTVYVLQKVV